MPCDSLKLYIGGNESALFCSGAYTIAPEQNNLTLYCDSRGTDLMLTSRLWSTVRSVVSWFLLQAPSSKSGRAFVQAGGVLLITSLAILLISGWNSVWWMTFVAGVCLLIGALGEFAYAEHRALSAALRLASIGGLIWLVITIWF